VRSLDIDEELSSPAVHALAKSISDIGEEVIAEVVVKDGLPIQVYAERVIRKQ
jgi:hypothetical protein